MSELNHIERDADSIIEEIKKLVDEYHQKINEGLKDPEHFLKMGQIEEMLDNLCKSTENIYLHDTIEALSNVDERRLIASKKENTSPKELS